MFEPGHPHHPPKDGTKLLGPRTPADRKAIRDLTRAVRDRVDPQSLVEWHQAVAAGHNARLAIGEPPKKGWTFVTWDAIDREGVSVQAKAYAMKWLSERGWGLPVQQIQLDGEMRRVGAGDTMVALPSSMSLGKLNELRRILRPAPITTDPQGLIPAIVDTAIVDTAIVDTAIAITDPHADASEEADELDADADGDGTIPASVIDAESVEVPTPASTVARRSP